MSMGSLLLAAGAKGKRYILPNATVMIHQPSGGYSGVAEDIAIHAKEILRLRRRLNEIYMKHLTKPHTLGEIGNPPNRRLSWVGREITPHGILSHVLKTTPHPIFASFRPISHYFSYGIIETPIPIAYFISNIRFPTSVSLDLTCNSLQISGHG